MAEHYFTAEPSSVDRRTPIAATVWGHELTLQTASGVFAAGRLDRGTAVLFRETAPPSKAGTFLDLGCGYGVIACGLAASTAGATVWAVDVNERALQLTRDNATGMRLSGVRVALPDDVPDDVEFDEIWSNPPIHIGKAALHDLLLRWLRRLAPDGRATLVVGKNLGGDSLQRWLGESGFPCTRTASAKGFRILVAQRAA